MGSVVKVNKDSLANNASSLNSTVTELSSTISSLGSTLSSIPGHSEFGSLTSKASLIADSLESLNVDSKNLASNIKNYIDSVVEIDGENIADVSFSSAQKSMDAPTTTSYSGNSSSSITASSVYYSSSSAGTYSYSYSSSPSGTTVYTTNNWGTVDTSNAFPGKEYNYEGIEKYLEDVKGTTVTLPAGLGSIHTYMGWQCITAVGSTQYKLREVAGMKFDEEGFAKIGDRYVVATTTTFGKVGDFIDVYQSDGSVIKCVIGDIKNQNDAGCNQWGHDNGHCVVEFVVDKNSWYGTNKTVTAFHPEFNQNITKIVNKGNYFDLIQTDAAKLDETNNIEDNNESAVEAVLV